MPRLEEIENIVTRRAITAALEAARGSYGEIASAHDELNALEAQGVYQPGFIEERRQETAKRVRQSVEGRVAGAQERIGLARKTIERELAKAPAVDPGQLAAAQGEISMLLGDLREDPDQLLAAYEQSFGDAPSRRAIENLAGRVAQVLPDTPKRGIFESNFARLRERLEYRLPQEEKALRQNLSNLHRAAEYLNDVLASLHAAIKGLVNPRQGGNLTIASRVFTYEREVSGASAIEDTLPQAFSSVG